MNTDATMNKATTNGCYNEQFLSIKSGCYNEQFLSIKSGCNAHRCYNERMLQWTVATMNSFYQKNQDATTNTDATMNDDTTNGCYNEQF